MSENQSKTFTISIECEVTLNTEDIWPGGDAPENPTAKDVVQAMQDDCTNIGALIADWNFPAEVCVWNQSDRNDRARW